MGRRSLPFVAKKKVKRLTVLQGFVGVFCVFPPILRFSLSCQSLLLITTFVYVCAFSPS